MGFLCIFGFLEVEFEVRLVFGYRRLFCFRGLGRVSSKVEIGNGGFKVRGVVFRLF